LRIKGSTEDNRFEKLNPAPEWVVDAVNCRPQRKRRRVLTDADSSSEADSDDDVDIEDSLSAQPLARLLRDAGSLTKSDRATSRKRKIRPEVIDIQRMRDISTGGPVSPIELSILNLPF
jgi:U3 small nucleolar RNA-associated protein 18